MLRPLRRELLDRAYDVFARYRSHRIKGCECCASPEFLAELNGPPRELSPSSASGFGISVMATVGNEISFKRLLPRLLELDAESPPFMWKGRLDELLLRARFKRWPTDEYEVVAACLEEAAFDDVLNAECFDDQLFDRLTEALLERFGVMLDGAAVAPRWYALLICELGTKLESREPLVSVAVDWVLARADTNRLERAFFESNSAWDQQIFSSALQVLEWFT
ncbi:MAG: hypothetical protein JNJ54_03785 [Myxococcaceae bacterium]|nr:hypothetical protein [Myxococcaceae bacterium]